MHTNWDSYSPSQLTISSYTKWHLGKKLDGNLLLAWLASPAAPGPESPEPNPILQGIYVAAHAAYRCLGSGNLGLCR